MQQEGRTQLMSGGLYALAVNIYQTHWK